MIKIYNNRLSFTRDFFKKDYLVKESYDGIDIFRDIIFNKLTQTETKLLERLLQLAHFNSDVYVSQSCMADYLGRSREQVNRLIAKLKSYGLIKVQYRHKKTCLYQIADMVYLGASYFSSIFPILKRISKRFLEAIYSANVTQYNIGNIYTKNKTYLATERVQLNAQSPLFTSTNYWSEVYEEYSSTVIHTNSLTSQELDFILSSSSQVIFKKKRHEPERDYIAEVKMKLTTNQDLDWLAEKLNLSQYQLAHFVCFPDAAIVRLNKHIASSERLMDWNHYFQKTKEYCLKNGLPIDLGLHEAVIKRYGQLAVQNITEAQPIVPLSTHAIKNKLKTDVDYARKFKFWAQLLPDSVKEALND